MINNITSHFELENDTQRRDTLIIAKEYLKTDNYNGLIEILEERLESPVFLNAFRLKYDTELELLNIEEDIKIAKGNKENAHGKKTTCYVDVRTHSLKYRNLYEKLILLNNKLDEYREITAKTASYAAIVREKLNDNNLNNIFSYSSETLGNFVKEIYTTRNDEEQKEYNLGGIGGSNISTIMKSHKNPASAKKYYEELLYIKSGIEDQKEYESNFATQRGDDWERFILYMYADKNPSKNIAISNTRWVGKDSLSFMRARFDGLELDDNGSPVGIIEIKTGVLSDDWGATTDSFNNMPINYRQQVIWYAKNAGLSKGTLVALLDDKDYREYELDMNDPRVVEEWNKMNSEVQKFWNQVLINRERAKREGVENLKSTPVSRKGFPKTLVKKETIRKLANYTGENIDKVQQDYDNAMKNAKNIYGSKLTQENTQEILTTLYAEHDPGLRDKPLIGIDIETSSLSSKQGRIIEAGLIVSHPDTGKQEKIVGTVYDIPEISKKGVGIGATEVHRIELNHLNNKKMFEDAENQQLILEMLKKGVMVAHNAGFEKDWLVVNLQGFAELLDNDEIQILDTMQICSQLIVDSKRNNLESFAEYNGIAYEGAHSAITDTVIMMKALRNFQENLYKNKKPLQVSATIEERDIAVQEGLINDALRFE